MGTEVGKDAFRDDEEICDVLAQLKLRPELASRDEAVLARYIDDMRAAVREVTRVLAPGGRAVYVVGENTVRGTYVRNSAIVSAVAASCGLRLAERRVRTLPANRRYLPPPSVGRCHAPLDARMRREVLLAFTRPAA